MTTSTAAPRADAGPHLDAVAAALARHGIGCSITRPAGTTPVLVTGPPAGPGGASVAIDPDPWGRDALRLDCTCVWAPPPGTAPEAIAATMAAVLAAAALTAPRPQPPPADTARLAAFLAGRPGWSAFWDKRYGLWRATEDDPASVLYAEASDPGAIIAYITRHPEGPPAEPAEDRAGLTARSR